MRWEQTVIIAWLAIGSLGFVLQIGDKQRVITPQLAAYAITMNALIAWLVLRI